MSGAFRCRIVFPRGHPPTFTISVCARFTVAPPMEAARRSERLTGAELEHVFLRWSLARSRLALVARIKADPDEVVRVLPCPSDPLVAVLVV